MDHSNQTLSGWPRGFAGATAALFAAGTIWLANSTVATITAAPDCEHAPAGCVVKTTAPHDSALLVVVLAAAVLFALIAVSGRLWTFEAGTAKLAPVTDVKPATEDEAEKAAAVSPPPTPEETIAGDTGQRASLALWASLDPVIASAIDEQWREWFGATVVDRIKAVRRDEGRGNHAWYVQATNPEGADMWVRATKGGRAGGTRVGHTAAD